MAMQPQSRVKIIKEILDEMVKGTFIGDETDLLDNFNDQLSELAGSDREAENLAQIICDLYEFIK